MWLHIHQQFFGHRTIQFLNEVSLTLFLAVFSGIDQNWHQWIRLEFYSKLMKVNYGYHVTCWTSAIVLSAFHNKLQ